MWVIKLGGSLIGSTELCSWLGNIAKNGDGKVIIVPGGGVFADAVEQAQILSGVDNATAHRMAVMAMEQYGVMMIGLNPALVAADCELEIAERGWQHLGIVWLASRMVNAADDIPKSWDVSSDSLAAWLAHKLEAAHLVIVKSVTVKAEQLSVNSLIERGWVDPYFNQAILQADAKNKFKTWILDKTQYSIFNESFHEDALKQNAIEVLN